MFRRTRETALEYISEQARELEEVGPAIGEKLGACRKDGKISALPAWSVCIIMFWLFLESLICTCDFY